MAIRIEQTIIALTIAVALVHTPAATFAVDLRPFHQVQELVPADLAPGDQFGVSFAVDEGFAVVGAYGADQPGRADVGAIYTFVQTGLGFQQHARLSPREANAGAYFGISVALDGKTMIVGAPGDGGSGAAYVFVLENGGVSFEARLKPSDGTLGDRFGRTVAIDGDTVLVGAFGSESASLRAAGAAYVFVRVDGVWYEEQKLVPNDPRQRGRFGAALALAGDTALVATADDEVEHGSVYHYLRRGRSWYVERQVVVAGTARGDGFGSSLALQGKTLAIAAPSNDHSGRGNAGALYVLQRRSPTGPFVQDQTVVAADPWDEAWFASGIALSPDLGVLGASSLRSERPGAAYVFARNTGTWAEQQMLIGHDAAAKDRFGAQVAIDGDTILVGGRFHDHAGVEDTGAVYVFARRPGLDQAFAGTCRDDVAAPVISCNAPRTLARDALPITFTASAVDECGPAKVEILGYACQPSNPGIGTSPCHIAVRDAQLTIGRLDRTVTGVRWQVRATDAEDNTITMRCGVEIGSR